MSAADVAAGGSSPRLWIIGCGNMAGAMLSRWVESGVINPAFVHVMDREERALPAGVTQGRTLPEGPLPDIVMLGVKPQQLDAVAAEHGTRLAGVPVLLSILAGVEGSALAARFSAGTIVRVMPNLPVALGRGVVSLQSDDADAATRARVDALMAPLGLIEWIAAEQFDAITALAGSGPAFVYRFIDALAAGAQALGLSEAMARRMALATVDGAAGLAMAADVGPDVLADRVASPGGTTRAGLDVLDADAALAGLVRETLAAAARRSADMAAAARRN